MPAALTESIQAARGRLAVVAIAAAILVALDVGIALAAQHAFATLPVPKKPTAPQLEGFRMFVLSVLAALAAVTPLPATLLAVVRLDAESG